MSRPKLAVAAAVVLLPMLAAAAPDTYRCGARGGRAWHEYRSRHFLLDTDASEASAALIVSELETTFALELQALLGEQVEIPGRVRVVAFASPGDFERLADAYRLGSYGHRTWLDEPEIVLPIPGFEAQRESVAFQVAGHLGLHLFPRAPAWFRTGLAMFVQTIARDEATTRHVGSRVQVGTAMAHRVVGLAPRSFAKEMQRLELPSAAQLLAWDGSIEERYWSRYNYASWLLYHHLWNARSKQFSDYQARLSAGEGPAAAWRAAFPELDPKEPEAMAALDRDLERYRRAGRYVHYSVSGQGDSSFTVRPLTPADVHLLVLEARRRPGQGAEEEARVRAELDEALREEPMHPVAIVRRAGLDRAAPLESLRAAAAARPSDARAAFWLGRALAERGDPAQEAAFRRAVALDPDLAVAQEGLARALVTSGRAREALPFANRALDLAPWSPRSTETMAMAAAELGQCPQALTLQRRAVEQAEGGEVRRSFQRRLGDLERRCTVTTAGTTQPVASPPSAAP